MTWLASARAKGMLDDVLWALSLDVLTKTRTPDPTTRAGFDAIVRDIVFTLDAETRGARSRAVDAAHARMRVAWQRLTPEQREHAVKTAMDVYRTAAAAGVTAGVSNALEQRASGVIQASKRGARRETRREVERDTFSTTDERIAQHAGTSTAHYVRNSAGLISERLSNVARKTVAAGLKAGHSDEDIARSLGVALKGTEAKQSSAYLAMIASVFVARSRAYGILREFEDAGIATYELRSVLDERTTDICRHMHGKRFSVQETLQRYQDVADGAPEDVVDLQPFIRQGKTARGDRVLFVQTSAGKTSLATVDESGVGRKDEAGRFTAHVSDARLQSIGCCSPPFHPHCRTTMVSVFAETHRVIAPAAPAAAPQNQPLPARVVAVPATGIVAPVGPEASVPVVEPTPPANAAPSPEVAIGDPEAKPSRPRRPRKPPGPFDVRTIRGRPVVGPPPEILPRGSDYAAEWAKSGARIDVSSAEIESMFGKGKVPAIAEFAKAWGDGDIRFAPTDVTRGYGGSIDVAGTLLNADGKAVSEGSVTRRFKREDGKLTVEHAYQVLRRRDPTPPRGFGTRVIGNAVRLYTHIGVSYVEVHAAWSGQFVWPSLGFDWMRSYQPAEYAAALKTFLRARGGPMASLTEGAIGDLAQHPWKIVDLDDGTIKTMRDNSPSASAGDTVSLRLGQEFFYTSRVESLIYLRIDLTKRSPSFDRVRAKGMVGR